MDMAGSLLSLLFKQLFNQFTQDLMKNLQRKADDNKPLDLAKAINTEIISKGIKGALATGNWGKDRYGNVPKTGVSQVLNRLTFLSSLSALRRLNTPLSKQGKMTKPRQLHNSHWGMICPAETPEGSACGLVKNLSLMSFVSVGCSAHSIIQICEDFGMAELRDVTFEQLASSSNVKVFINGNWVGCHENAAYLVHQIKTLRRQQELPAEMSIVRDITNNEIRILTDQGRVQRPCFIV